MSALVTIVVPPFVGALAIALLGRALGRWSALLMVAAAPYASYARLVSGFRARGARH